MRARLAVAALVLGAAVASAQDTAKVAADLKAALEREPAAAGRTIKTETIAAPASLTIVRAVAVGSPRGTGAFAVLVDKDGTTYGKRGQKDLADLARARGWLEKPPEAEALVKLANAALFDGSILIDEEEPPILARKDGVLSVRFVRRLTPRGRETVVVKIGKEGPATTATEPG